MSEDFLDEVRRDFTMPTDQPPAEGRYRFEISGERTFWVDLRVDPDGVISGDLFADAAQHEWVLSFLSEALFANETTPDAVAAVCAVEGETGLTAQDALSAKLILLVRFDGPERIETAHMAMLWRNDGTICREWSASAGPAPRAAQMLRAVTLELRPPASPSAFEQEVLDATFDGAGWPCDSLRAVFATGPRIALEITRGAPLVGDADSEERLTRLAPADDPLCYRMILSTEDCDGAFGTTPGMTTGVQHMHNRLGAVVQVAAIIAKARQEADDPETIKKQAAAEIRRIVLHELAHLMNLPHPWQRGRFDPLDLASDPASISVTNYPSLYPHGILARYVRQRTAQNRQQWREMAWAEAGAAQSGALAELAFDAPEILHLRHAAYGQIAAGYSAFVDSLREEARFGEERSVGWALELLIEDCDPMILTGNPPGASHAPLWGKVRIARKGATGAAQCCFSSGTLRWIFQPKDAAGQPLAAPCWGPLPRWPRGLPDWPALSARIWAQGLIAEDCNLAEQDLPLPLPRTFWNALALARSMDVQALFLPHSGAPIYSNRVTRQCTPATEDMSALVPILADPLLPALVAIARSQGAADLAVIGGGRFAPLVTRICALSEGGALPRWLMALRGLICPDTPVSAPVSAPVSMS